MKKINFSHYYLKLLNANVGHGDTVRLILCMHVKLEDLPQAFKDYDTNQGLFKLPKRGKYMLLIFQGSCGIFPTLRSEWPPEKVRYYDRAVGENFEVCIEAPPKPKPSESKHLLPCPYHVLGGDDCEQMSPFIRTKKNGDDVFKCAEHGRFAITADGDILTFYACGI